MRSVKSFVASAFVLLAALAVIMLAPAVVTASQSVASQNHVTWHVLKLAGGYINGDPTQQRPPSFGTNGTGIVYLAGLVCEKPPLRKPYFAIIPKEFRPAHDLVLPAFTGNETQGPATLNVLHAGGLATGSHCVDLAGISYPAGE